MLTDIKYSEKAPDVSIIIPVYNVEKQLFKCLKSISDQEFSGTIEIIAVEACSTDKSLKILEEYQTREPRLKIIKHEKREMLSTSRMKGFQESKGEYLLHVDSDDWLLPGAIERLYSISRDTDCDVVVFDYYRENSAGIKTDLNNIKDEFITSNKNIVQKYFLGACWNKFVKRSLNENLIYGQEGATNAEDLVYSTEILLKANNIYILNKPYYVYYLNTESSSFALRGEAYIKNQLVIMQQLEKIIKYYSAAETIKKTVLDYFEKWIYLELSKNQFWKSGNREVTTGLVRSLYKLESLGGIRSIEMNKALNNKYVCLLGVLKRFNIRMCLGIIRRTF
jgi:glycosyltransferase involved in cell wall biosynthesis